MLHVGKLEAGPQSQQQGRGLPCKKPKYGLGRSAVWTRMGAKLKMKADLLAEEGGTVSTLSDTMETKEKSFFKNCSLAHF